MRPRLGKNEAAERAFECGREGDYEREFSQACAAVRPPAGELHATRDAMRRLLLNGAGSPNENPTPARRPGAKRPQRAARRWSRRPRSNRRSSNCCDCRRDYERQRSPRRRRREGRRRTRIETSSGEGPDRARRRQRRVASAGLTAKEIGDLLAPGTAAQCERWIKPLVVYDFRSVKE